jgi:hypothetical protein
MKPRLSRGFFLADAHDASHFEAGALVPSWALPPWRSGRGFFQRIPPDHTARLRCGSFAFRRLRRIQNWRSSSSLYRLHCGLIPIETGPSMYLCGRAKENLRSGRGFEFRGNSQQTAPACHRRVTRQNEISYDGTVEPGALTGDQPNVGGAPRYRGAYHVG